jgi:hypothetical protein
MKSINIILIFIVLSNLAYAQSIGVTPSKNIMVELKTPTAVDFSVSQGSDYPEKIIIEGDYSWLKIPEREFILESKTGKSVMVEVLIKKPGKYTASLKVCGSEINDEGGFLSAQACTTHTLTVFAKGNLSNIQTFLIIAGVIVFVSLITFLIILFAPNKKRKRNR